MYRNDHAMVQVYRSEDSLWESFSLTTWGPRTELMSCWKAPFSQEPSHQPWSKQFSEGGTQLVLPEIWCAYLVLLWWWFCFVCLWFYSNRLALLTLNTICWAVVAWLIYWYISYFLWLNYFFFFLRKQVYNSTLQKYQQAWQSQKNQLL